MQIDNYFIINAKLPSLNEYINACRTNKYQGYKFKKEIEEIIGLYIISSKNKGKLKAVKKPVKINFEWHEKTMKRDPDNIASAKKYILDALQTHEILRNDSQKYIKGFSDEVVKDKDDYVKVTIYEVS